MLLHDRYLNQTQFFPRYHRPIVRTIALSLHFSAMLAEVHLLPRCSMSATTHY